MIEQIKFEPIITFSHALNSPSLFGNVFEATSFWPWKVIAKLIDGLPLTEPREIELFEKCTGRIYNRQARRAVRRLILLVGRRGGKDRFMSADGEWRAALCTDWRQYLSAGEQAVVILLGKDKKQAAILRRYCHGLLQVPDLAKQVVRETAEVIEFRNGASLEITVNDAGGVRGRSAIAVLGSECCHWKTGEHAQSNDEEVVSAAENSMALCPDGGLLILGSSVHRRTGFMYRQFKELYGNNDADDLVWLAPSKVMNPQLPQSVIDKALAQNPHKANADYNCVWREDSSECFALGSIEAITDVGVHERPYSPGTIYVAYQDSALGVDGGSSFALAISHRDAGSDVAILDLIREKKPPFVFHEVIAEFAQVLKRYGVTEFWSDHHAHKLFSDEWKKHGIACRKSETSTADNYKSALPLVLGRRARLLDNTVLKNQLSSLELHTSDGEEKVVCPQNSHDDVATAAMGSLVAVSKRFSYDKNYDGWCKDDPKPQPEPETPFSGNPCNGDWWKWRPPPRPPLPTAPKVEPPKQQPTNECDKNLIQGYRDVDLFIRGGGRF